MLRLPVAPLRKALQDRKQVWKNLKNWLRLHTLLHFCRERAFLGFMSADSGLKFLNRLRAATFSAGQTIQANGLAADTWHLIERGTVQLRADGSAGAELGPGDSFGELALLGSGELPRAVALSDVCCQVLARQRFDPKALLRSKVGQSSLPAGPDQPTAHEWVPQLEPADCGLGALAMVSLRLGKNVSVEQLRERAAPGPRGLTLRQLRQLADSIGLSCLGACVSAERLDHVSLPAIVHLLNGHYVVLHEIGDSGVMVGDPATGIVTWSRAFLAECYSGSLLLFDRAASV